jgi:hypothetical protein
MVKFFRFLILGFIKIAIVAYAVNFLFYPYNYLLALAHKLYKGDSTFSTKGEFMSYAFKAKYGFISFAFILISSLIISLIGELNPDISLILLFILFLFFIVFGISVLLPLPKKLRSKTYPKPTWKSYIWLFLIISFTTFVLIMQDDFKL